MLRNADESGVSLTDELLCFVCYCFINSNPDNIRRPFIAVFEGCKRCKWRLDHSSPRPDTTDHEQA